MGLSAGSFDKDVILMSHGLLQFAWANTHWTQCRTFIATWRLPSKISFDAFWHDSGLEPGSALLKCIKHHHHLHKLEFMPCDICRTNPHKECYRWPIFCNGHMSSWYLCHLKACVWLNWVCAFNRQMSAAKLKRPCSQWVKAHFVHSSWPVSF